MQQKFAVIYQTHHFHYIIKARIMFIVCLNKTLNDFLAQRAVQESVISQDEVVAHCLQIMKVPGHRQSLHLDTGVFT